MRYGRLLSRIAAAIVLVFALSGCRSSESTSTTEPAAQPAPASAEPAPAPAAAEPEPAPAPAPAPRPAAPRPAATQSASQQQPAPPPAPAAAAAPAPAPAPAPPPEPEPIVVEAGTPLEVTIDQTLSSESNRAGDRFDASLAAPVVVGDRVAIPAGSRVSGTITEAQSAGRATGTASLGLRLDSITVRGTTYRVVTGAVEETGGSRGRRTAIGTGVGAAAGAIIGAIAGGGRGAAIGAGTGAGAGAAGSVLTGERDITIPAETRLQFTLTEPVSIKAN